MSSWVASLSDLAVRAVTMTGPDTVWGYAPYMVLTISLIWTCYVLLTKMSLAGPPPLFGGVQLPELIIKEDADE
jgi:hypothetical protein